MKTILILAVALFVNAQCAFAEYVGNTNTYKFHDEDCWCVERMADHNKYYTNDRDKLIDMGMAPCKKCRP